MGIVEKLVSRHWVLEGQDPQPYYEARDNAKELEKRLQERLGYALTVDPYLVKLEKIPDRAES